MQRILEPRAAATALLSACFGLAGSGPAQDLGTPEDRAAAPRTVTFAGLVAEAADLGRLARLPDADYRLLQWSSFDRRSRGPEDPGWFTNADGFGGEPIPNVEAVLEAPDADGVGRYLLGEVAGPGAIVRTWSAGMNGTIRAFVDGALVFDGPALDFLVGKAARLSGRAALPAGDPLAELEQEDADHLPLPFAEGLRIEWTGALRGLHFYQIQLRRYAAGTAVRGFRGEDLDGAREALLAMAARLRAPALDAARGARLRDELAVEPGGSAALERAVPAGAGGEAMTALRLRVEAEPRDAALRGLVMRIAFDGSERPQVEAPVGDFFGSGPGVHPFVSLPMTVEADGTMECRFVMPYARSCRISFHGRAPVPARIAVERVVEPFDFDGTALHFRARWRVDRDLRAEGGAAPCDLPFVVLRGRGRFVGCAVQIVNPSGIPTPGGNWWGEGDEKVFVDEDLVPSTFGTGSEDYFDYSWSRPDLFAFPYCGQPLCSGPGTSGFVSNHRFQILDDIPFERFFAFLMELWTHRPLDGVEYGRIAYLYARPGVLDDHVRLQARDVELPVLPIRTPVADGGARDALLVDAWDLGARVGERVPELVDEPLATRHRVLGWRAERGEVLRLRAPFPEAGAFDLHLVAVHAPDGARVRARIAGQPVLADGRPEIDLRSPHQRRLLSIALAGPPVPAGEAELELECVEPGFVGLDYAWIKLRQIVVPGCVEGEGMRVVRASEGLEHEAQGLGGGRHSGGRHLWVRARAVGDFVELRAEGLAPGRYRASLRPTESWDYAVLAIDLGGERRVDRLDTWSPQLRLGAPVDLGLVEVGAAGALILRVEVVDTNPAANPPRTYFGIDGVLLEPVGR
jgi:hypothetical protein